jgi:hypothetical protein
VTRRAWVLALCAYGALLWASAPAWPDDWDGIGFLAAISRFDLARFQPHPPGYPVYVALLRAAAAIAQSGADLMGEASSARVPMRAAVIVAAASGVATAALVSDALWRAWGPRVGCAGGLLVGVSPIVWRACSGVGSEGPALAFLAACAWGLTCARARPHRAGAWVLGMAAGLGLGVRLSWAPLYGAALLLAPAGARLRAWTAASIACAAWGGTLVALVGPAQLVSLYATHFAGHAERWGGTVATEPGSVRLAWLARDVFVDGLGVDRDPLGWAIAVLLAAGAVLAVGAWRAARWQGWKAASVAVVPYLAWVALGQNLRDQPRHLLPIAAILAAALAPAVAASRRAYAIVAALALAMAVRAAADSHARRTIAPPGRQLVDSVAAQPFPAGVDVFGVASIRFFEGTPWAEQAFPAEGLGDVEIRLARAGRLPQRVWITEEVSDRRGNRWAVVPVATFCRPPRIDRRMPCLHVDEWELPFLRR